jgi:hypothetical protein
VTLPRRLSRHRLLTFSRSGDMADATEPPSWSDDVMRPVADAADDRERLRLLATLTTEAEQHLLRVRAERLACAARLRDEGVAMIDIARWARVSDSYLTRRLLAAGRSRRIGRRLDYQ